MTQTATAAPIYRSPHNPKGEMPESQYRALQSLPQRSEEVRQAMTRQAESQRLAFASRFPEKVMVLLYPRTTPP